MGSWRDTPMLFGGPTTWNNQTEFPINVIEDYGDGTMLGTIDESNLSAAKRLILDATIG